MSEIARRYAQALYEVSPEEPALRGTAETIMSHPELWKALLDPTVRADEKKAVLQRLPGFTRGPLLRFYELLAEKGRMALLPDILNAFHTLTLEGRNAAECVMTCVHAPDQDRQEKIKKLLCKLHHRNAVELSIRQDSALIGGFTLELEGVVYDQSVRGRLAGLAEQMQVRRTV